MFYACFTLIGSWDSADKTLGKVFLGIKTFYGRVTGNEQLLRTNTG